MDWLVNLVSVVTAVAALGVAVWQVRRSVRMAAKANALPIAAAIFGEVRSGDFRTHLRRLLLESPGEPPDNGFEGLPEKWRDSAYAVGYFYDYLGVVAASGIIDERLVISAIGTHVIRAWITLEPFIRKERCWRKRTYPRDASPGFLQYFEHLVVRNAELGGREAARRIQRSMRLRTLPQRATGEPSQLQPWKRRLSEMSTR